jgi:hypothetical protein
MPENRQPMKPLLSRRSLILAPLLAAALPARAARPITTNGITFDGDLVLADTALQLNGVGLRSVAWIKGYAAGLYLPRRASTAAQVYAQQGAKRLRMVMMLEVDAEEFVRAFHKGVNRNMPAADLPRLGERMERFDGVVRALDKLRDKDVIDLDYLPERGLLLSYNARPRGEPILGEDLYTALLSCFIGDKPVDNGLKAGLLGGG